MKDKLMTKDWKGKGVSVVKNMGASNHSKVRRPKHDYYATEPKAVRMLLELEKFDGDIWECACGEGHLSKEMIRLNYKVKSTDIVDRGYGSVQDFLKVNSKTSFNIITNPPYSEANAFIEKALEILPKGKKLALFLPIRYLEGQSRKKIFLLHPPKTIYVSSSRLECVLNGNFDKMKGSAVGYAWFVWEKGFYGKTSITWFN